MYAHSIAETTAQINERFPMDTPTLDVADILLLTIGLIMGVLMYCCIKGSE